MNPVPQTNILVFRDESKLVVCVGGGLYKRGEKFFHRPLVVTRTGKRQRVLRSLKATTKTKARDEMAQLRVRSNEAQLNPAADPYARSLTAGKLADDWLARNCPDRKGLPRTGDTLKAESARLAIALKFFTTRTALTCNRRACRDYHTWRLKNGNGHRLGASVDKELQTLANLFAWALNEDALPYNPLAKRPRFDDPRLVRHCTAVMPPSDEVFHQTGAALLATDETRALGWQYLLEGLTGARTCEILACRTDAKQGQPGFVTKKTLYLHRAKKGIKPWALLECIKGHSPLAECLSSFLNWHRQRYPHSPWFIPGKDPAQPMSPKALTHALRRVCLALEVPVITSHGLRAYHVRALRSLGIDGSEIAKRLGHRSGVALVEKTYGESEPGWFGNREQDFLPDGLPAWHGWVPESYQLVTDLDPKQGDFFRDTFKLEAEQPQDCVAKSVLRPLSSRTRSRV